MAERQDIPPIALLVITDGRRDCIEQTLTSAAANLPNITERWIYDDSADPENWEWLLYRFPDFELIASEERRGFGGAIQCAWRVLRARSKAAFIFHLEDDFTFNRPVPIADMRRILTMKPTLAQVALRRQAWNEAERRAGGVIESNPSAFTEHTRAGLTWLEHNLFFTTNPCLYRRDLIENHEWPDGPGSEGHFSIRLRDVGYRFAYLGGPDDMEHVTHIGSERVGTGY